MFEELNNAFVKRFGKYLKCEYLTKFNRDNITLINNEPFSATESRYIAGFEAGWKARGINDGFSV